jgi:serine protease SohB
VTQFFLDYGLFLAKAVTLVVAIAVVAGAIASAVRRTRDTVSGDRLEIRKVNDRLKGLGDALRHELLSEPELKAATKARKAEDKALRKARKHGTTVRSRVFVLDFEGDLQAHAVASLREEISAILQVSRKDDEVLLRLESAGGLVHAYGLASSQLSRVRDAGLKLTVSVDKIAASGGYMMACVGHRILAAPFAVIGSIGVVAQLPNFNRLLRKNEIDVELHTAGEFKRTLTLFGENTEAARAKFREELDDTHALFKTFVAENRPVVEIDKVATGEHWYGTRALVLKLVDELRTSDDYLLSRVADADVFEVRWRAHKPLTQRLGLGRVLGRRSPMPDLDGLTPTRMDW